MSDQTPAGEQYKPITSQPPPDSGGSVGDLPFSGLELGAMGGVALLLTVFGVALMRAVKRPWQDPQG